MSTADNIKALGKSRGLTQRQLAERSQMIQQRISQYESGTRLPKMDAVNRIAAALGVSSEAIIDPTDYKTDHVVSIPEQNLAVLSRLINGEADPLLRQFQKLNSFGKKVAIERIEELTEIPRYQNILPQKYKDLQSQMKTEETIPGSASAPRSTSDGPEPAETAPADDETD